MLYEVKANIKGLDFNFEAVVLVNSNGVTNAMRASKKRLSRENNISENSIFILNVKGK